VSVDSGVVTAAVLAFLPALVVSTVVPGLNNILVLRTTAESGPAAGAATAAGASAGIVAWATAAALGVGGLVLLVPGGISGVRAAGAVLMVGTGLWGLVPRRPCPEPLVGDRGFATGLVVCLANPRTPVVALATLPQYAVAGATTSSTVVLGLVWAGAAVTWNLLCVGAVARGGLARVGSRAVQRAGALALVGLGAFGLLGTQGV
jgi:threonine/homoserine/homoserine lactone efflux protein